MDSGASSKLATTHKPTHQKIRNSIRGKNFKKHNIVITLDSLTNDP